MPWTLEIRTWVLFGCIVALSGAYPMNATAVQPLLAGDYRVTGPGVFRRVIVTSAKNVSYDIWRIQPAGSIEHLHFDFISPSVYPIASEDYSVHFGKKVCGTAGLRNYVDADGFVHPAIMIMRYRGADQPLSSGARQLTDADYAGDRALVRDLERTAQRPHFYSKGLSAADQRALSEFVPQCPP